jgi:hypothetical protein
MDDLTALIRTEVLLSRRVSSNRRDTLAKPRLTGWLSAIGVGLVLTLALFAGIKVTTFSAFAFSLHRGASGELVGALPSDVTGWLPRRQDLFAERGYRLVLSGPDGVTFGPNEGSRLIAVDDVIRLTGQGVEVHAGQKEQHGWLLVANVQQTLFHLLVNRQSNQPDAALGSGVHDQAQAQAGGGER